MNPLRASNGTLCNLVTDENGVVHAVPLTAEEVREYEAQADTNYMLFNPLNNHKLDEVDTCGATAAENYFTLLYPGWKASGYEVYLRLRRNK